MDLLSFAVCVSGPRPVDDAFTVQEHEGRCDLGRVETCSGLLKLPGLLDVEHQIATIHKFHHKEETVLKKKQEYDMVKMHVGHCCVIKHTKSHRRDRVLRDET